MNDITQVLGWQRYAFRGNTVTAALVAQIDRDAGQSDEALLTLNDGAQVHVALSTVTAQHPNEGPFFLVRDAGGAHSLVEASGFDGQAIADEPGAEAKADDSGQTDGADAGATGDDAGAAAAAAAATDGDAGEGKTGDDVGATDGAAQSGQADGAASVQGS